MSQPFQKASFTVRFVVVSAIGLFATMAIMTAPLLGISVEKAAIPLLALAILLANRYIEKADAPLSGVLPAVDAVTEQELATQTVWHSPVSFFVPQPTTAFAVYQVAFAVCLALPTLATPHGAMQSGSAMGPVEVIVVNETAASVQLKAVRRKAE